MFFLLVGLALFTAFAFVVTNEGAGRAVSGLRSIIGKTGNICKIASWIRITAKKWQGVTTCKFPMINITYYNLTSRYISSAVAIFIPTTGSNGTNTTSYHVTTQIAATVNLVAAPIPQLKASYDMSIDDNSIEAYQSPYRKYDNTDCITYENDPTTMCFMCNSCKVTCRLSYHKISDPVPDLSSWSGQLIYIVLVARAGVAQYIKKDWRLVAVINISVFVFIVVIYAIGCCARRNASRAQYTKV
ncbi:hypothetical protein R1flu_001673 [Riccia fluitans]|uniref:Uncharacterized protein n=1 Tax=Riccia fluitans TaxID=41844 RepID=A0ABD1Y465_9MARC